MPFARNTLLVSLAGISPLIGGITLPPDTKIEAKVELGQGTGLLSVAGATIRLEGTAAKGGKYVENWKLNSAVLDFLLPKAIDLPGDVDRIGFDFQRPPESNTGEGVAVRTLIEDARGGVWALGTRLGAAQSRLGIGRDFRSAQSYSLGVSEAGRIDPWVMTSLTPERFDAYDAPQPPFRLAGFRVVVDEPAGKPFAIVLRDVEALKPAETANPYWTLFPQRTWSWRKRIPALQVHGEHGWGGSNATPRLKASSLNLAVGRYQLTWEILQADGWRSVASGVGDISVQNLDSPVVEFPLLPAGTYQVRLGLRREGEAERREAFLSYVVLRNSAPLKTEFAAAKPLQITDGQPAKFTLLAPGKSGSIDWVIESADQKILKEGNSPVGSPVELDLTPWADQESAVWLSARLKNEAGATMDSLYRVLATGNQPAKSAATATVLGGSKFDRAIQGQFFRMKGDWAEGATSAAAESVVTLEQVGPWLDEAKAIGYNFVELSAPWDDLNPLPGVYQFEYLDRLVAEAKKRGLHVILRIHPLASLVPAWVKQEFVQDEQGFAHGVWNGGDNLIFSPSAPQFRKAFFDFLTAIARHYRNDADVVGYVLESLFFDHDLVDMPWLGQYVDYSEASREAFHDFLRGRYESKLGQLNEAYGTAYKGWTEVPMPRPEIARDAEGRIRPRTEAAWKDWSDFKIGAIREFRLGGVDALRQGDPDSWVGLYASDTSPLYADQIAAKGCWVTYGSMETQYPVENTGIRGRYEPHGKMARTATLVDVGMTNILMSAPPGHHGFFNYWFLNKRMDTIAPAEREAEERLKLWFSVVDRLMGAKPFHAGEGEQPGACLISQTDQLALLQHVFMGRTEDYLKPWNFRVGADKVRVTEIVKGAGNAPDYSKYPFVYIPYCSTMLDPSDIQSLAEYVKAGGRLAIEATSGFWSGSSANALAAALGLPEAKPGAEKGLEPVEAAKWEPDSPLKNAPLAFRTQAFSPPINDQLTPWIHNIPRAFLRPYRLEGALPPDAKVLAKYADQAPAAVLLKVGKGEVLLFAGVVDWLGSPGLAKALDGWGRGHATAEVTHDDPEILVETLTKAGTVFAVGRRFLGQSGIEELKNATSAEVQKPESRPVRFAPGSVPKGKYRVRELLGNREMGSLSAETLMTKGVALDLSRGQAFLLEAQPE